MAMRKKMLRFLDSFTVDEVAEVLPVSRTTAQKMWDLVSKIAHYNPDAGKADFKLSHFWKTLHTSTQHDINMAMAKEMAGRGWWKELAKSGLTREEIDKAAAWAEKANRDGWPTYRMWKP